MIRFLFILLALTVFSLTSSNAGIYKGQRIFIKKCSKCHKDGENFVENYKMEKWKKLMEQEGKLLARIHLDNPKAKKSWNYFKSKKYAEKSKYLKQFLVEYAKDSGHIPVF